MKHILSYGGGVNSTALYFLLRELKRPIDVVIFADTGNELPATYKTVEQMKKQTREDNVEFVTVNSHLAPSLYEYCWKRRIFPFRLRRFCTVEFKVQPIRRYLRKQYGIREGFVSYIGIAYDEAHRMKDSPVKYIKNDYPLVDYRITRRGCQRILKENGFKDVAKSGCWFCPFAGRKQWLQLLKENPDLFNQAMALEENGRQNGVYIMNIPLRKLKESMKNQKLLTDFTPSCDVSGSCFL